MVAMKDDKVTSLALGVVMEGEGLSCGVHSVLLSLTTIQCFSVLDCLSNKSFKSLENKI